MFTCEGCETRKQQLPMGQTQHSVVVGSSLSLLCSSPCFSTLLPSTFVVFHSCSCTAHEDHQPCFLPLVLLVASLWALKVPLDGGAFCRLFQSLTFQLHIFQEAFLAPATSCGPQQWKGLFPSWKGHSGSHLAHEAGIWFHQLCLKRVGEKLHKKGIDWETVKAWLRFFSHAIKQEGRNLFPSAFECAVAVHSGSFCLFLGDKQESGSLSCEQSGLWTSHPTVSLALSFTECSFQWGFIPVFSQGGGR